MFVIILAGLISCNQSNSASIDLMQDESQKEAAFEQILNNPDLLDEFMDRMMQNTDAMHLMIRDQQFMDHMFSDEHLDYMHEHNEHFMNETMNDVMRRYGDDSLMRSPHDMMQGETPMN